MVVLVIDDKVDTRFILKRVLFISPLFLILYFETLRFGPLTISIIWKFFLILILLLIMTKRVMKPPMFVWLAYIFCLKSILVLGVFDYPVETITPIIGWVAIPLLFQSITTAIYRIEVAGVNRGRYNVNMTNLSFVQQGVITLLLFYTLAVIPFWFGLEPLVTVKTLISFGIDKSVFQGYFQNVHAASGVMSITAVSLLFFANKYKDRYVKTFMYFVAFIALLAMLQTFVRTGIVMFIIGFIILNIETFKENKAASLLILLIVFLVATFFVYFEPAFFDRMIDNRAHGVQGGYKDIGSGRLYIWETNINNLMGSGFMGVLFGLGTGLSKSMMYDAIGLSLVSHSGLIDALVQNGLIGLGIFISYFIYLFKYINKYKYSEIYYLLQALFFMYLTFQFLQGGNQFLFTLVFAPLLVLHKTMGNNK